MRLIRVKNISDNYFQKAWELYEEAFPFEERRLLDDQIRIFKKDNYHFDVFFDEKQFIGFILWWEFESRIYIDHFATSVQQRNKGIGKLIMDKFIESKDKSILLEVELPTLSINARRIQFYERFGFKLNQHYYEIPPLNEGQPPLQLLIMSYPSLVSKNELELFVEKYHPIIFENEL